ncbi:hypothetical protein EV426DRAFT_9177 [Tirmania nivea]|nr:hypothetical protein EV426DRAFT_9177 [Tirmania nivea]
MSTCALRPLLRSPTIPLTRPTIITTPTALFPHHHPSRNANLLRRPQRPMLLPQLIILSDGSAYTQLSTSPRGVVRSTKDVRNHPLWNPTLHKLMDVEEDEAGRLQAFRERYGRGWDNVEMREKEREEEDKARKEGKVNGGEVGEKRERVQEESLVDLLSGGFYEDFVNRDGGKKKKRVAAPVEEAKDVSEAGAPGKKK